MGSMNHAKKLLAFDFIRFCMVGTLGFGINFGLLTLLYKKIGAPLFFSQLLAAEIALFHNFIWHHKWTYKNKNVSKTIKNLLIQFHATSWMAIVGSAVIISVLVNKAGLDYVLALILSSGAALAWNFAWTKLVIWRHEHEAHIEESA